MQLIQLPYQPDSSAIFDKLAGLPGAVFLDSGKPYNTQGRYDILSAIPIKMLVTQGKQTEITGLNNYKETSTKNPFDLVTDALNDTQFNSSNDVPQLPFHGGAIGYFSYDLVRRLETLPTISLQDPLLPEMTVGIYDWAIVVDHQDKKTYFVAHNSHPHIEAVIARNDNSKQPNTENNFNLLDSFTSNLDQTAYALAFQKIQHYLQAGDCYQVNLAQRLSASFSGSPWQAYKKLRRCNPATFGAFLNTPTADILSLSPERFLQVRDKQVETKPIKGTRPRSSDPQQDQAFAAELLASNKERAENLMIVDLLRNDLHKNCLPGSIQVPELFTLESLASVHHLVSTIIGTLAPNKTCLDLLKGCFPGGSITGTPKLRAMEIIEELEPQRRNIYCGSIGYIDFNGNMDTNIAIRTLLCMDKKVYCSAGGAITIDSKLEEEYAETFAKVSMLLKNL